MPEIQHSPQLAMLLEGLSDLPPVRLPDGYTIRTYLPGDASAWDVIISQSFRMECEGRFERDMRTDSPFRPERVFFICRGEEPVATAAAWHRPQYGAEIGYLHMVGVLPSEAGMGLGLQVSLACLHRMKEEGRTACILHTDDYRIPAIKTYLKLGFRPLLIHEDQRQRWRDVLTKIGRPELAAEFAHVLDGPVQE